MANQIDDDIDSSEMFDGMCKEQYKTMLFDLMAEGTATVFSSSFCPYCPKAKELLNRNRVGFTEITLDHLNPNDQMEIANCIFGMQ